MIIDNLLLSISIPPGPDLIREAAIDERVIDEVELEVELDVDEGGGGGGGGDTDGNRTVSSVSNNTGCCGLLVMFIVNFVLST